jgi:predicted regulator of Ras-like GTPase activity (Roadblock/LC7/MglB family)
MNAISSTTASTIARTVNIRGALIATVDGDPRAARVAGPVEGARRADGRVAAGRAAVRAAGAAGAPR